MTTFPRVARLLPSPRSPASKGLQPKLFFPLRSLPPPPPSTTMTLPIHPQPANHTLSLLSAKDHDSLHKPISVVQASPDGIKTIGATPAQIWWLNAAKCIDWIKEPKIAYGHVEGELVSP